jgi:hypothetical protein
MGVIRRSRLASIAALAALAATLFVVCPCRPPSAGGAAGDPHACCKRGAAALVADHSPTCCDGDGTAVPAVAAAPAVSTAAPAVYAADLPFAPGPGTAARPPAHSCAFRVLRL